jgi:O-antigen/teichoic acid export membrane protein
LRGKKEIALALVSPSVLWPVGGVILTYILLQVWDTSSGLIALAASGFALIVLCIFQFGAIRYVFREWLRKTPKTFRDRLWFTTALPLLLMTGFQIVLGRVDVIMTGSLLGATEVGIYSAALRTGGLISFVLGASSAITAPMISEYWSAGEREKLERTVEIVMRWAFWSSVGLSLVMVLTGKWILGLFGESFVAGYWVLVVIILGKVVHASMGPVTYLLALTGHERLIAKILGVAAVANIILNYLLILNLGILGAALATALTTVAWNLWLGFAIRRKIGIDVFSKWANAVRLR